jgi:hypothetical protein
MRNGLGGVGKVCRGWSLAYHRIGTTGACARIGAA